MKNNDREIGFVSHLTELRKRLINTLIFLSVLFVICYLFSEHIYGFLVNPYAEAVKNDDINRRLIFTALQETFLTYLKVSFFTAFFVTCPYILMQIWKFIAPGLYKNEKRAFLPFLIATPILFFAGGAMVYYLISPVAWKFFLSYQNMNSSGVPIRLEAKMGEYLSLMMRFIFAFGLAFQLPVVLGLMAKVGLVDHESLKKFRKYAIVITFLSAAFLTPPDPFSQISLALPIILLYEISIYIAKIIQRNKNKEKQDQEKQDQEDA